MKGICPGFLGPQEGTQMGKQWQNPGQDFAHYGRKVWWLDCVLSVSVWLGVVNAFLESS